MNMQTCENHNRCVVVYDSQNCPLCEAEDKVEMLEEDLVKANDDIDELRAELDQQ